MQPLQHDRACAALGATSALSGIVVAYLFTQLSRYGSSGLVRRQLNGPWGSSEHLAGIKRRRADRAPTDQEPTSRPARAPRSVKTSSSRARSPRTSPTGDDHCSATGSAQSSLGRELARGAHIFWDGNSLKVAANGRHRESGRSDGAPCHRSEQSHVGLRSLQ